MKAIRHLAAALALAACWNSAAAAQSLRDLRAQEAADRELSREAAYTSEVCGRPISAGIDWASVKNWPDGESVVDACNSALGAVETICRAGRTDVVKSFICAGDGAGATLSGGVLRYGARPGGNGYATTLAVIGGQ